MQKFIFTAEVINVAFKLRDCFKVFNLYWTIILWHVFVFKGYWNKSPK